MTNVAHVDGVRLVEGDIIEVTYNNGLRTKGIFVKFNGKQIELNEIYDDGRLTGGRQITPYAWLKEIKKVGE